jgi:hypothetical protein
MVVLIYEKRCEATLIRQTYYKRLLPLCITINIRNEETRSWKAMCSLHKVGHVMVNLLGPYFFASNLELSAP